MKARFFYSTQVLTAMALLAATAAMGDTLPGSSQSSDAHTQAAALLSRPQIFENVRVDSVRSTSVSTDAHAAAAALLSRPLTQAPAQTVVSVKGPSRTASAEDAQAKAAALLSRPRAS